MVVSGRLVAGMLSRSHSGKALPRPKGISIDSQTIHPDQGYRRAECE